jgi:predicted RNase H-like HicB family nuclease
MKTYTLKVVLEPDEDIDGNPSGWHAFCPALERQGTSTWGATEEEALKNIDRVLHLVVKSMLEHGEHIPEHPADQAEVTVEPRIVTTVLIHGQATTRYSAVLTAREMMIRNKETPAAHEPQEYSSRRT